MGLEVVRAYRMRSQQVAEQTRQSQAKRVCYSVIISEHNLPEYQACLDLAPDVTFVISSRRVIEEGKRFCKQLKMRCPDMKVVPIGNTEDERLEGHEAGEIQLWLNSVFDGYYRVYSDKGFGMVLNLTGGTKIMSLLLKESFDWQALHYQAEQLNHIQVLTRTDTNTDMQVKNLPYRCTVPPVEHGRLYSERVDTVDPSPLHEQPTALACANDFLQAQLLSLQTPIVWHPWLALTQMIDGQALWDRAEAGPLYEEKISWQDLWPTHTHNQTKTQTPSDADTH